MPAFSYHVQGIAPVDLRYFDLLSTIHSNFERFRRAGSCFGVFAGQ
jgi:hypothetical protein